MDDKKMQIIQELMDLLQEEMQPTGEDFGERLGRPAAVEVEIESKPEDGGEMAMDGSSEEDDLRDRLMNLRG